MIACTSASQPYSDCDQVLLILFVGPTMTCCEKSATKNSNRSFTGDKLTCNVAFSVSFTIESLVTSTVITHKDKKNSFCVRLSEPSPLPRSKALLLTQQGTDLWFPFLGNG